jgi:signal transduction histidine kinase
MADPKILIVEDEAIVGLDIEKKLKNMDYQVRGQASSGEEAIQKAEELKPDLVLMDIKIKGKLDGIDAARQIKTRLDIPVIFVTAYADDKMIKRAKATDPYGYILKPINKRELHTGVEMALNRHQSEKERKKAEEALQKAHDELEQRVKERTAELERINQQLKLEIEERKQAEREKEKMRQQLIQSQMTQAIATLAGGIAHNFNNALVGITANIELLQLEMGNNETTMKFTEPMKTSVQQMASLTNQLLAYARGGKYQPQDLALQPFIDAALLLIQYNIGAHIQIETDFPDTPFNINADMTQMQMVLSAVLNNAAEAMGGRGKIRIAVKKIAADRKSLITNVKLEKGAYACIDIEDEGIGMDRETRNRIFEPFFTTKIRGRGLSMAAVYGIIQNHHGTISVDSEPDRGTRVTIYVPLAKSPEKKSREPVAEVVPGTGTVLLIEDDDTVIDVTRRVLEKLGYRVLVAETGREAEKIVRTFDGNINLAILDIGLPDMPGEIVYSSIKKTRPDLKVLVSSGYGINGPARAILDNGAEDFIQKPFSIKTLSEKLKTLMGNQ